MDVVYWKGTAWEIDSIHLKYQDYVSRLYVQNIVNSYQSKVPELQSVEIETVNRCNNDCSFCPVAAGRDIRERKVMSEELFFAIINELSNMDYRGYISLFSNNEPLLDARIFDFLGYAKERLPHAHHALYTNGTLLTEEKYQKLVKNLDYLVIDNYNDAFELNPNIQEIQQNTARQQLRCKVRVEVRKKHQILSNRGGVAPNKAHDNVFLSGCILPFMQMVIRPDGKVSLCCQDAYGLMTLGDVGKDGIRGVWEGSAYQELRREFIENGRIGLDHCRTCDIFDLHNYFPDDWVHIYLNTFLDILWKQKEQGKKLVILGGIDDALELADILYQHGINLDATEENFKAMQTNRFYVFPYYDWEALGHFEPAAAGEEFIVFQNPNHRRLQQDDRPYSLRFMYGKICRAASAGQLVVFGAGRNAQKLWDDYRWQPKYYVDNNAERVGTLFLNREICLPDKLREDDTLILVSANDFPAIYRQLRQLGIAASRICNGNRLL